ncbi:unnamed protein product [Mytilus coruscus]|uniref:Uncharacterized protein n=1 Tax=Mytilus coruscus TaxID=42192 RepID=A0A6J8DUK6_MYTCO|nr:unnamed protein product [Mytilus coruscus]
MDRLPKFLIKAIECASEEYGIITYSFHGDNDKTRISIMFSNTDTNKQVKRKSGSARRRDNRRLKEFNDTKSNTEVLNVDDIESIDLDNMNIDACTVDEHEERIMNTDIPLLGASSFTHSIPIEHVGENIERCTFNKQVTVDIPIKQVINSDRNLPVGETIECNKKRIVIHSEVSNDQEEISVDNDYEEIDSVSYQDVNMRNAMIETSNQPITDEERDSENIPISTCSSSTASDITMSHVYVNTDIFKTNESRKGSVNNETVYNNLIRLGNCNIGIDSSFVNDNSEGGTSQVHQYVNMTIPSVLNVYEDLNETTADTHKYEILYTEGTTAITV